MITFPTVEWKEYDPATDPSGVRHLQTTGFIKVLDTGAAGQLDFGSLDITGSGAISDTKLVLARMSSAGDASGIFNMKFFLSSITAWNLGTYRFLCDKNLHFIPDNALNDANEDASVVIPALPNVRSTVRVTAPIGGNNISGVLDEDVTQYIWLAVLSAEDTTVGQYGGPGFGSFRFTLMYDFA